MALNDTYSTGGGLTDLLNPFLSQVRDVTLYDLERQRKLAEISGEDAARAAGAFGGARHGVADALIGDAFAREGGRQFAGLNAQGFNTAANLALQQRQQDIGYNLGQTANTLSAYQMANSLLNSSGLMDWLSLNQANNATSGRPTSTTVTQDGGSPWNNILGSLITGFGLVKG